MDANLSILNLVIVTKREKDIPGQMNTTVLCCLGSKRTRRNHSLFSLSKDDDHQYVVRKSINKEGMKFRTKSPQS